MNTLNEFKLFVKQHPNLIRYVKNNEMTWQKFYEIYSLYGEDNRAWKDYLTYNEPTVTEVASKTNPNVTSSDSSSGTTNNKAFGEFMNMFKGLDANKVQSGITSIQKTLGLIGDLFIKNKDNAPTSSYQPRPMYQHFDD